MTFVQQLKRLFNAKGRAGRVGITDDECRYGAVLLGMLARQQRSRPLFHRETLEDTAWIAPARPGRIALTDPDTAVSRPDGEQIILV